MKNVESAEKILTLALSKKNFTARKIRECKNHLETQKEKMKLPFSLNEAYLFPRDVFPNVAVVLQLMPICAASGAIVETGFSVMHLIINELHSSFQHSMR